MKLHRLLKKYVDYLTKQTGKEAGSSSLNIYMFSFEGPFALTLMKFKEEIRAKRQGKQGFAEQIRRFPGLSAGLQAKMHAIVFYTIA
ncbi:MAG: hypothetical protein ABIH57_01535 [Candidatus Omnitrophota bacterium]